MFQLLVFLSQEACYRCLLSKDERPTPDIDQVMTVYVFWKGLSIADFARTLEHLTQNWYILACSDLIRHELLFPLIPSWFTELARSRCIQWTCLELVELKTRAVKTRIVKKVKNLYTNPIDPITLLSCWYSLKNVFSAQTTRGNLLDFFGKT